MVKLKAKSQPLRLLSYGQSTSTPVAIATTVGAAAGILSLLLQFIVFGISSGTNRYVKGMTVVQLQDGSISPAKFVGSYERDDETIKRFISDSMIKMFGWNGIIEASENGENITKPDRGIDIQTKRNNRKKIPTRAWEAAFALSENQDFRANFIKKLAEIVPSGVFNGEVQVSLVTRHISKPRKIKDGKWEVDYIGTLVSFNRSENQGKGIAFNKTITVEAIDTPKLPAKPTELDKKIHLARRSGLEITQIVDYNLGKKEKY
ncbi:hypothetical protein QUB80_22945 [Chlorogloeopsis sp. ULAP01]|jgi:hypothetical protein|uniref:hypothetical protein n=1 Tax=Chlorogloeopsis sp. ULAP01 TaxID=3056483 RepID=UPI0025AAC281|nr:hypothetical protein [Chlorogloeopsis sp. ULAP01]MDM9383549.1 hypothetical protein [Chlorogloeopsis sp. ULAP01]